MRQAGRYLPEYRQVRQKFTDFMQFCLQPEIVTQVTLQPIERFDFDAAIIFSDILIIPHALGQTVKFLEGTGPVLASVAWPSFLQKARHHSILPFLDPVFQAIHLTRQALAPEKSLIGFVGSPWTLACYMMQQGKIKGERVGDFDSVFIESLLEVLQNHCVDFLKGQIQAGCDVVQIFDSWASLVPAAQQGKYLWQPLHFIFHNLRKVYPHVPIIYYGRGVSEAYPILAAQLPGISFGLDQTVNPDWAAVHVQPFAPVQGNLDPEALVKGEFKTQVKKILDSLSAKPFVFNLGHGILPTTPLENVYQLIEQIRHTEGTPF